METIADRIKFLRTLEGENQQQLATAIGVAQSAISQWESRTNEPKASYIVKLCDHFNVSADYLLGREDMTFSNNKDTLFYTDGVHTIKHLRRKK